MMIDRWDNKAGLNICVYDRGCLQIGYTWLFLQLGKLGFETMIYVSYDTSIHLKGTWPREKTMEIKRFFFDNYPGIITIVPTNKGMIIKFSIKIKLNQPISLL